ncbi:MAG TPA: cytochrome c biogenesis protein ResB [Candidatus Dormibacteraeota bacterium]|nr:cytochrome c biogenesis protein ResB [Candidatus Dormibacteraeota bacterium]
MAHEARTRPIAGHLQADDATDEARLIDLDRWLDALWRFLTSMRLALVLILALAALGVVGALLVQAPAGVQSDAAAKADWLDQVRPKYGGWTNIMDTLGLFNIFNSLIFRVIAAGLVISTLACSIHRIPGMWKTATRPHVGVGEAFFEHAPQREKVATELAPAEALELVKGALGRHHYRTIVKDDGVLHVYADRFRWAPFAGLIGHLSLVVIVLGAMVGATLGFRDSNFVLAEGASAPVPTMAGLQVKLLDFQDSYYTTTGAPADYVSDLVLTQDGKEVAHQQVRVNSPLRYGDISFYQSFYGPAAQLVAADASGKQLFAGGVALAWTSNEGNRRVGSFTLPDQNLTVWVVGTGGSADTVVRPGQMRVEVYKSDDQATPVGSQSLDPGKPATIGGVTFTFQRESQFTGLSVAKDPGAPLIWLGCALLFFGFVIRFTVIHRRIWARIAPRPDGGSTVALASVGHRDVALATEHAALIEDIRRATGAQD